MKDLTFAGSINANNRNYIGTAVYENYGLIENVTNNAAITGAGSDTYTLTVKSSKTGANQQYMAHLLDVKLNKTRYAMAYAVVDGATVYSEGIAHFVTGDGTEDPWDDEHGKKPARELSRAGFRLTFYAGLV